MIFESKTLKLIVEKDRLKIIRAKSFRFWQWTSFFTIILIIFGVTAFIAKINYKKFENILQNKNLIQIGILFCIIILEILAIVYLYRISRKSTKTYLIRVSGSQLFINSEYLSDLSELNNVITIKNVGWKGLGISYTI